MISNYKKIFILFLFFLKSTNLLSQASYSVGARMGGFWYSDLETKSYGSIELNDMGFSFEVYGASLLRKYFLLDASFSLHSQKDWESTGDIFAYKSSLSNYHIFFTSYFLRSFLVSQKKITPMLGFGLGISKNTLSDITIWQKDGSQKLGILKGDSVWELAFKFSAVLEYELTETVAFDFRVDYKLLGSVQSGEESEVTAIGNTALIGLKKIESENIAVTDISFGGKYFF